MNNTSFGRSRIHMGIIFVVCILFLIGAITLFANFMHRQNIKDFETKGKVYSGVVTDNYFFYAHEVGTRTNIRTRYMICFKPNEPVENHEILCSSEYISRNTAQKYPVGSIISGYFRNDIQDMLLIPGIESWRENKVFQYLPYGFLGVGVLLLMMGKVKK